MDIRSHRTHRHTSGRSSDVVRWLAAALLAGLLLLAGCGGGASTAVDVQGRLLDSYGLGIGGVAVAIDGHGTTFTGSDGSFAFAQVATPYDLIVFDGRDRFAQVWEGVTTATPEVIPALVAWPPDDSFVDPQRRTAYVDVDFTLASGEIAVLCIESSSVAVGGCTTARPGEQKPYFVPAYWYAAGGIDATVRVVRYAVDADEVPTAVLNAGSQPVSLSDGSTLLPVDVTTNPMPPSAPLTIDAQTPFGFVLDGLGPIARLPDGRNAMRAPPTETATQPATFLLPEIEDATWTVLGAIKELGGARGYAWWTDVTPGGPTAQLVLPPTPDLLAPDPGAVGATRETRFTVATQPDEGYVFVFTSSGAGPDLAVATRAGAVTLPDLAHLDARLALVPGDSYTWKVIAAGPTADAPGVAGGFVRPFVRVAQMDADGYGPGPATSGHFLLTAPRSVQLE